MQRHREVWKKYGIDHEKVGVGGQATPRAEIFLREGGGGLPASVLSESVSQSRSRGGVRRGTFRQKVEDEHFLLQNRLLDGK